MKPLVLLVDDGEVDLELARSLLAHDLALQVVTARNGREALVQIERQAPALIVTDLQMPEVNGLELVREVRQRHDAIPVVLMTAHGSEAIAAEALRAGAAGYVPKRDLARDLRATVTRLLALRSGSEHARVLEEHFESIEYRYCLPNESRLASALSHLMIERMATMGLGDETDRFRVAIALEEALSNAMHHGNLEVTSDLRDEPGDAYMQVIQQRLREAPYALRRVTVHARLSRREIRFIVRDEGGGFDPSSVPDPALPENLARSHGRGLMLIHSFMDEVRFNDTGNEVEMACTLSAAGEGAEVEQEAS